MAYTYCPQCGEKLLNKKIKDEGSLPYCPKCDRSYFSFTRQCVLVGIVNEFIQIALTKQNHIAPGQWILVSGFIKQGETIEETVFREVREETGLKVEKLKYIKSYYISSRDLLMLGFAGSVRQRLFQLSDEIDEINWFNFNEAKNVILKESIAEELLNDIFNTL